MTSRCTLAADLDLGSAALAEHTAACETCARAVALRVRAKQTWAAAIDRDDRTERSARERRLMSGASVGRARRRGTGWAAGLAVVAVALATWMLVAQRRVAPRVAANETALAASASLPAPVATAAARTALTEAPRSHGFRVVDVRGGVTSRAAGPLAQGETLAAGDEIQVEREGVVRVLWVIDLGEEADSSTQPAVEIVGPARVDVGDGSSPLLVLRRGVARVTAGSVAIARGDEAARDVQAGHEVDARGADAASARPAAIEKDDPAERLHAAEAALDQGDRAAAEAILRALLARTSDPEVRARAELRLSELLLARGAADEARALLEPLAFGSEPKRGADAAWLYARSLHTPADRASAWARYLATSPPPAMRSLALVERASALFDSGDADGARAIVAGLDAERERGALAPVATDALRRLEARLGDD